jgi:2-octaprenylphenol hydroxylase
MSKSYDVLIIGGGMVGLTLANLLRDSGLSIGIIESHVPQAVSDAAVNGEFDARVSAISRASLAIFKSIGVWENMQRVCAFRDMHVWDFTGAGSIHFDSAELGLDVLGYIIENRVIQQALLSGISNLEQLDWLCPRKVESIEQSADQHDGQLNNSYSVHLDNNETLDCKLLVGADGANSLVREFAGIELKRSSYQQSAIVCTVNAEQSHAETAWQCFLPSGPLAFLPLDDGQDGRQSSIVWSLDEDKVEDILLLDDDAFCRELEKAFQFKLGAVVSAGKRASFSLAHGHVDRYVQQGLVLVGDAAHTIHPLAGQGANLGFLDADCLADVIVQARDANRQWYAQHTLRKYERARKGENRLMESAMTGFKFLFGNENPMLSSLRNAGLGFTDQLPLLKNQLMRHALGIDSRLG